MALHLCMAEQPDKDRIAVIHMAAFGTNAMLIAQFPTPSAREDLQKSIAKKAADDINDPKIAVLVVKNEAGEIVSFAKWSLPILASENYVEPPWTWGEEWKGSLGPRFYLSSNTSSSRTSRSSFIVDPMGHPLLRRGEGSRTVGKHRRCGAVVL